jgi:hypothetical protein
LAKPRLGLLFGQPLAEGVAVIPVLKASVASSRQVVLVAIFSNHLGGSRFLRSGNHGTVTRHVVPREILGVLTVWLSLIHSLRLLVTRTGLMRNEVQAYRLDLARVESG